MNPVTHGLVLTVVGMGLVFLALVIFLVSMVVLARLFPDRETSAGGATAGAKDRSSSGPSEAELAAIGAALAIWSDTTPPKEMPHIPTLPLHHG